ncbi:hypothetical protein BZG36_02001 [Bifiguratus adelaidae]|uniref:D-aminoacyl-tRNA deacylase n=1 Tax=Bifiguratus adelaidae TaxID=1938954 RepID=A0A261Y4A2_9FUNG|nr:hypothetical protein BZG36_02001 [Bifiguratus adelaidae]
MRAVLQRVSKAGVTVDGQVVGRIGKGLCILLGISVDDGPQDVDYMVRKILTVRVFEGEDGQMWRRSVKDLDLDILCVSQFTLWGVTNKGNKPDFHLAMKTESAREMYDSFLIKLGQAYHPGKIKSK